MRRRGLAAAAVLLLAILTGCTTPSTAGVVEPAIGLSPEAAAGTASPDAGERATFISVVDGDTIETSAGTVRLIGIDTPERGECGEEQAASSIAGTVTPGDVVLLALPSGQNAQDRYGRLLRYVTSESGVDLGLLQLEAGNAVARYDSRDGYPAHPREGEYHAAQVAALSADGSVMAAGCEVAAAPAPPTTDRWWEQYTSCTKLKKNSLGHPAGPFSRDDSAQAEAYDWFAHRTGNNGDGDGDGLACE